MLRRRLTSQQRPGDGKSRKRHEDPTRCCPAGSVLEHLEHLEGGAVPVEAPGSCHRFSGLGRPGV